MPKSKKPKSKPPETPAAPASPTPARDNSVIIPGAPALDNYPIGPNKPKLLKEVSEAYSSANPVPIFDASQGPLEQPEESRWKKCRQYMYNRKKRTFCERTCTSWWLIIIYSIIYLLFLATYTQLLLYGSLEIQKLEHGKEEIAELRYYANDVGLTVTPTSENSFPIIYYRIGETSDYDKYVSALDKLVNSHRNKTALRSNLGPCGFPPYGYGEAPCVIVRINRQITWAGIPLRQDSTKTQNAPKQVQKWIGSGLKKLWLHCDGQNTYDKEHIGSILYYPSPPGFDPHIFPVKMYDPFPLIGVQFLNFTIGVSLSIQCNLWYEQGESSLDFVLYVAPKSKFLLRDISAQ